MQYFQLLLLVELRRFTTLHYATLITGSDISLNSIKSSLIIPYYPKGLTQQQNHVVLFM